MQSVVIVGAGAAGFATAEALRRQGFRGKLTIIGDETEAYDRPPLSKEVLSGSWPPQRAALLPAARLKAIDADLLLGCSAAELDVEGHRIRLDDGSVHEYDDAVIATGLRPRRLVGHAVGGCHVLRTMDDSRRLQAKLREGSRLLIVGGGFLGLEVASTARRLAVEVSVVDWQEHPLRRDLGESTAAELLRRHRRFGVDIRTRVGVDCLLTSGSDSKGGENVTGARLTDGTVVLADAVLVAIGAVPNLGWLANNSLSVDDGVLCNEFCQAGHGVWAAGDVLRWVDTRTGAHRRMEHRTHATESGRAVARNIMGQRVAYLPVPFIWTCQYDIKIQLAGTAAEGAELTVIEHDLERDSFLGQFREKNRVVGVLGWNAAGRMAAHRAELERANIA